jgi:NAD(P)-dependent dehydrogenase (short-subunit alcohol dehydrogenase family)
VPFCRSRAQCACSFFLRKKWRTPPPLLPPLLPPRTMPSSGVLLTNASRFAGPALTQRLLAHSVEVLAVDPAFQDAAVRAAFAASHPGAILCSDSDPALVATKARAELARLDAVVCNDYFPAQRAPLEQARLDDLRACLDALVVAPFALLQAVVPQMKAAAGGRVVIVSSASPLRGLANYSMYATARGAQNALMLSLAKELAPHRITVNAVAPNYIDTPAYFPKSLTSDPAALKKMTANIPLGRLGRPEELAALVEFVALGDCGFITGAVIPVAGGFGCL